MAKLIKERAQIRVIEKTGISLDEPTQRNLCQLIWNIISFNLIDVWKIRIIKVYLW